MIFYLIVCGVIASVIGVAVIAIRRNGYNKRMNEENKETIKENYEAIKHKAAMRNLSNAAIDDGLLKVARED